MRPYTSHLRVHEHAKRAFEPYQSLNDQMFLHVQHVLLGAHDASAELAQDEPHRMLVVRVRMLLFAMFLVVGVRWENDVTFLARNLVVTVHNNEMPGDRLHVLETVDLADLATEYTFLEGVEATGPRVDLQRFERGEFSITIRAQIRFLLVVERLMSHETRRVALIGVTLLANVPVTGTVNIVPRGFGKSWNIKLGLRDSVAGFTNRFLVDSRQLGLPIVQWRIRLRRGLIMPVNSLLGGFLVGVGVVVLGPLPALALRVVVEGEFFDDAAAGHVGHLQGNTGNVGRR